MKRPLNIVAHIEHRSEHWWSDLRTSLRWQIQCDGSCERRKSSPISMKRPTNVDEMTVCATCDKDRPKIEDLLSTLRVNFDKMTQLHSCWKATNANHCACSLMLYTWSDHVAKWEIAAGHRSAFIYHSLGSTRTASTKSTKACEKMQVKF